MTVRPEQPEDIASIRYITEAAFQGMEYSGHNEAEIIDALRAAHALTISLVAIEDEELVAHVAFSPVTIDDEPSCWYGLGPVAVRPDYQREGIGTELIRKGLSLLEAMGADGCVVLGEPEFYGRFGFEAVPSLELPAVPAEYFQCLAFGGRTVPQGEVAFHPAFKAT